MAGLVAHGLVAMCPTSQQVGVPSHTKLESTEQQYIIDVKRPF